MLNLTKNCICKHNQSKNTLKSRVLVTGVKMGKALYIHSHG